MAELQVPSAGRVCPCGKAMVRSGRLRWRCLACGLTSPIDPYLESVEFGAPSLPGMDAEPARRWVLRFDGHPLSPNDHVSLWKRSKDTKYWKNAAGQRVQIQRIPRILRARLWAVFYRRSLGVADEDNDRARLKPVVDGLVKAGVLPNDTRTYVEWGECREEHGAPGFVLVIEAMP